MSWIKASLFDVTERIGDGLHGTPKYNDKGDYFFINGNNFVNGKILIKEDTKKIDENEYLKIKKDLNERTVFVSINGTLGKVAFYKNEKIALGKSACYLNVKHEVDKRFIRYVLEDTNFQNYARNYATGSTIKNLGLKAVRNYSFDLPNYKTQKRIADILTTYDDLIENNLKRIKLLEQAAQNIYKEWFVNMRFPSHENTPIDQETGLPEGWEEKNINDVFNIKYGKNLPVKKIKNQGDFPVYGASGVMGFFNEFNTNNKVALVTSRGNGSGDIHRTKQEKTFITNNSFKVYPKNNYDYIPFFFITEFLKSLHLRNYCSGSAQPQLTNSAMKNIKAVFPNREIIVLFKSKVESIIMQVDLLLEKNKKLKSARDILLPRLMNQTIEV